MISFTVYTLVIEFNTYLQFVSVVAFNLVIAFVLVAQSFTDIGFNTILEKNFLQDGRTSRVDIKWEPFNRLLTIRALPVHTSCFLQW